ncbi:putative late embryogenesis abundant protein D-29-like [Cocos nucifera]|uniref:Putative late embryogenesis abundant protein D-29-like n=1 Tax=Cocos nucifera TaxID=13894 RepID=A0A8K0NCV4_COCNU|nr:putative late embryogenesis abundant protein D-29-like [Cocos nucifera]
MDNPDDDKLSAIPKAKGFSSDHLEAPKLNAIPTAQSAKAKSKGTKPSISHEKLMGILLKADEKLLAISLLASPITEEKLMTILKAEDRLSDLKGGERDQFQEAKKIMQC